MLFANSFFSAELPGLVMALPHRTGSEPKHLLFHLLITAYSVALPFEAKLKTKSTLIEKYWKSFSEIRLCKSSRKLRKVAQI